MKKLFESWRIVWLGILLVANVLAWSAVLALEPGELEVSFLDIGQGDAILIETPHHNQILIDGGPPGRAAIRALGRRLPFWDRSLDLIIATHPDADHIGGLGRVIGRYDPSAILETVIPGHTAVSAELEQTIQKQAPKRLTAARGQIFNLDDDVTLTILFPDRDFPDDISDTNLTSIVAKLSHGQIDFLLTGDSPSAIEKYLASVDGVNLQAEVLKAGHHGSKTSSDPLFLAAVRPEYAVISAGENNRYGHPHAEVLTNLTAADAKILRTDEQGTITFQTDGQMLKLK